jgi:hypothetical protein
VGSAYGGIENSTKYYLGYPKFVFGYLSFCIGLENPRMFIFYEQRG